VQLRQRIITALQREFSMKDLGQLHHFLGMHVQQQSDGFLLNQRQYMLDILDRAGMAACKPCATPIDTNPKLSGHSGEPSSLRMPLTSAASQVLFNTSPSLGQTLPMQFSKCASTCTLRETFIWLL
jgi:hypothetical protein